MRNQFDYLGAKTPERRKAVAQLIRGQRNAGPADLLRSARALWLLPEREYQYVAIDLLAAHSSRFTPLHVPQMLALVRRKSWWDTVDALSSVIGAVLKREPKTASGSRHIMDEAICHPNLWTRRVALIHQIGWRHETDLGRLFSYTLSCAGEKDFFIRKAIGWALRDCARHAPSEVRAFLRRNQARLSPLSLREAGKHILAPTAKAT